MPSEVKRTADKDNLIQGYTLQPIPRDKIDWVYGIVQSTWGMQLIPYEIILQIHQVNPSAFQVVVRLNGHVENPEICAIISLIPLTSESSELMLKKSLTGLNLKPEHVAPGDTIQSSAYLAFGGVITKNIRDYGASFVYTAKLMMNYSLVFTLPITKEGLSFAQRMGFVPVEPKEDSDVGILHIWYRNLIE
ncbi:MAG: hypothetical protein F6K25_06635 [Okeania sp. SIO2G4]|uniref:hypothetical protein n=1 Tax=unclassified Okeania TaxID=2634635 RepID=UPI0013BD59CD|nr:MULTISPECIES: hypothetical protein [unclassified Okeania]NEP71713.1 hypothetical protein [Okeania sp. SIO2G5]NEP96649.1 hypothetical protein [Okeania sp. SIO2F5]NEQ90413.1 hypothetical protein [Okeania sp. SIO2G4]